MVGGGGNKLVENWYLSIARLISAPPPAPQWNPQSCRITPMQINLSHPTLLAACFLTPTARDTKRNLNGVEIKWQFVKCFVKWTANGVTVWQKRNKTARKRITVLEVIGIWFKANYKPAHMGTRKRLTEIQCTVIKHLSTPSGLLLRWCCRTAFRGHPVRLSSRRSAILKQECEV
jgi:hypothetical protein